MQTRRKFIQSVAAGAVGIYAANILMACSQARQRKLDSIGYITGILGRNLGEKDWQSMFRQTAEMGYSEIETGNYLGDSPQSFIAFCREIGLKPIAGGIGLSDNPETIMQSIDRLNAIEVKYAVSYWPWFVGAPFSLEDCKRSADALNKMGEICRSNGLTLCWHNHEHEFVSMEEGLPFDYLMENTDPDLVKCQLDIYWVKKGGADPLAVLKQYSGRYPILHVKDMAPGEEQDFECPGLGIIDWPSIFNESLDQDIQHYIVERDGAEDGLACLKASAEFLKTLRF